MLGSSRESLASVRESLDARRNEPGFDAVSNDLFAVADLLGREKTLRVALADAGQPADGRAALAASVLGSRISPLTLDVVSDTVRRRWSNASDLVSAIEIQATQAAFTVAEADGTLGNVEEELFRFGRAIDSSADLQMALTAPSTPAATKAGVVRSLLEGRVTPATLSVLEYTASHLRGRRADTAVDELSELAAAQRNRVVAEVRVAAPLNDEQQRRLTEALSRLKGRKVQLNVAIDPTVIGGIAVRVGDEVIDGTVAARLEQARRTIAG